MAGSLLAAGQLPLEPKHDSGQSVTAAFEGWYKNPNGTFGILLGYYNRNLRQDLDIPVGPNNRIEPGGPDQGQPTHFLPGRQWGVFTVTVPPNFGDKKLIWTLTANGSTTEVPLSLNTLWELSPFVDATGNKPPYVGFSETGPFAQGPRAVVVAMTATVAEPLSLTAWVADDARRVPGAAVNRLPPVTVTWSKFRGPGTVTFSKPMSGADKADFTPPPDTAFTGKAATMATFSESGDYILRVAGNDWSGEGGGGFQCCWTSAQIKVSVKGSSQPNSFTTVENWAKLPEGRRWGSTSAVDVDADGKSIWVAERCGANSCEGKNDPSILKFDESGKLVKSFGGGMLIFPHGICVDADGDIWVTDGQAKDGKGFQVFKFSPEGKVLMTLGKAGVAGDGPDTFNQPNDVAIAPNGDIFVSDGHTPATGNARVMKFTKDGKFVRQWGGHGSGPGLFEIPHALAFDSKGRLFVGDRANNRIQIFDQDGQYIAEWTQFGRPSGIYIDKHDVLYVTDSESTGREGYGHNPGYKRGIRIGSAKDGTVTAFIPDPSPGTEATSTSEGVAADAAGNIYGAEVGPKDLKKYVRN